MIGTITGFMKSQDNNMYAKTSENIILQLRHENRNPNTISSSRTSIWFGNLKWPSLHSLPENEFKLMTLNDPPMLTDGERWKDMAQFYEELNIYD